MKQLILALFCVFFASSMAIAQDKTKKKETVTFLVENIHCQNCIKKIEKNIAFEKGVTDLRCSLKDKTAKVTYNTEKTTPEQLAAAFKKIGYDVVVSDESQEDKKQ